MGSGRAGARIERHGMECALMERGRLTKILQVWQANLITEQELRIALVHALRGAEGDDVEYGIERMADLKLRGIVSGR